MIAALFVQANGWLRGDAEDGMSEQIDNAADENSRLRARVAELEDMMLGFRTALKASGEHRTKAEARVAELEANLRQDDPIERAIRDESPGPSTRALCNSW